MHILPSRRLVLDGLVVGGFAVLPQLVRLQPMTAVAWGLSSAAALPLIVRRVWPVPVFAVVLTISCITLILGPGCLPAAAYALYTVALSVSGPRLPSTGLVGGVTAAGAVGLATTGSAGDHAAVVPWTMLGIVLLGGAWMTGRAVAERRQNLLSAIENARLDERLRIARDLHDIVTHNIGLIAVQAGVVNHVVESHPEEAKNALIVIEEVSRNALGEMRTMLGGLRGEPGADPDPGFGPGPGPSPRLGELPVLLRAVRAAGTQVELTARGVTGVPETVEVAAFRIVQEALTNVIRHAAPTRCRILVEGGAGSLTLEVSDDGPARTKNPGSGYGLIGMRERALAHGGVLDAGTRADGGYTVRATLRF